MSEPSNPLWRYGVYAFVIPPALLLVTYLGLGLFVQSTQAESAGLAIGSFLLTLLGSWGAVLLALAVAVSLFMDARALRSHASWSPNQWLAGLLGVLHVAGAVLAVPFLVSVPGIGYYVYRRRRRVTE